MGLAEETVPDKKNVKIMIQVQEKFVLESSITNDLLYTNCVSRDYNLLKKSKFFNWNNVHFIGKLISLLVCETS